MLRNNADARRCSYFELGLPVELHTANATAGPESHDILRFAVFHEEA